jgi:HTH-type transcriptional regulator/antitoxin HigA
MSHAIAVHPIRTARDLRDALARIDVLWDAKSGTMEGDELDVLTDLTEACENRHHPIRKILTGVHDHTNVTSGR